MLSWPSKDPNEILDYQLDWAKALTPKTGPVDSIETSEWTVPDGLVSTSDEITANSKGVANAATTIWLTGGEEGISYVLMNRVVTAGARTMDQSVKIRCKTK
jgi:hypothetical protein